MCACVSERASVRSSERGKPAQQLEIREHSDAVMHVPRFGQRESNNFKVPTLPRHYDPFWARAGSSLVQCSALRSVQWMNVWNADCGCYAQ